MLRTRQLARDREARGRRDLHAFSTHLKANWLLAGFSTTTWTWLTEAMFAKIAAGRANGYLAEQLVDASKRCHAYWCATCILLLQALQESLRATCKPRWSPG